MVFSFQGEVGSECFLIEEKIFNVISFIAQGQNEVVVAIIGVKLHDVPNDRLVADIDHGLGFKLRFLFESCADAAAEYNNFHSISYSYNELYYITAP